MGATTEVRPLVKTKNSTDEKLIFVGYFICEFYSVQKLKGFPNTDREQKIGDGRTLQIS